MVFPKEITNKINQITEIVAKLADFKKKNGIFAPGILNFIHNNNEKKQLSDIHREL